MGETCTQPAQRSYHSRLDLGKSRAKRAGLG